MWVVKIFLIFDVCVLIRLFIVNYNTVWWLISLGIIYLVNKLVILNWIALVKVLMNCVRLEIVIIGTLDCFECSIGGMV